ncbi:hypothetical protein ACVIGA_008881 [Bradyrhizobium sp. USDA 3240]
MEEVTIVWATARTLFNMPAATALASSKSTLSNRPGSTAPAAPILFGWRATRCFPETASLSKGDVFFEGDALRYLMMSQATDVAAVAPFNESMEDLAVLLSDSGVITSFRMKQTAANLVADGPRRFKTMNLLRLSATTLRATIVPALDDLIGSGATQACTEALLASLVERRGLRIAASRCDGLRWYEIDSTEDLPIAERIFTRAPAFDRAGLQNRRRVQRQDTFGIQKTPVCFGTASSG